MIYLLEVSVCLIAFYAFYYIFLKKKKFHQANRIFLLSAIVLALIIPALHIPFYEVIVAINQNPITDLNLNAPQLAEPISRVTWIDILPIVYMIFAVVFFAKTLLELRTILTIVSKSKKIQEQRITKVYVTNEVPLSSFFHFLFLPTQENISDFEYQHELAHINQYHSIDKIFVSLVASILWFNPVIYFIKKNLSEVHEYLADEAVIIQNSKHEYLNFIQDKLTRQYNYALINPFYSLIKNRLTMINNETKSSRTILLLAIPLCAVLLSVFACEEYLTIEEPEGRSIKENTKSETDPYSRELVFLENEIPDLENILRLTGVYEESGYCKCSGFNLLYAGKGKDIVRVVNEGSTFNKDSKPLIDKSKAGDKLLLDNIKLKCQGKNVDFGQVIITVANEESSLPEYVTVNDTITIFDEDTFEETVRVIERQISRREYDLLNPAEEVVKFYNNTMLDKSDWKNDSSIDVWSDDQKLNEGVDYEIDQKSGKIKITNEKYLQQGVPVIVSSKDQKDLKKVRSSPIKRSAEINGKREYELLNVQDVTVPKVEEFYPTEKNYLMGTDTVITFDDKTNEERIMIIEEYSTKDNYDAYRAAIAKGLFIYIRNLNTDESFGGQVHYEKIPDYLSNVRSLLNEKVRYVYEIKEKGKTIETSKSFTLADIK